MKKNIFLKEYLRHVDRRCLLWRTPSVDLKNVICKEQHRRLWKNKNGNLGEVTFTWLHSNPMKQLLLWEIEFLKWASIIFVTGKMSHLNNNAFEVYMSFSHDKIAIRVKISFVDNAFVSRIWCLTDNIAFIGAGAGTKVPFVNFNVWGYFDKLKYTH